ICLEGKKCRKMGERRIGVFKNCKNFNKMRNVVAKTMCMSELIQKKSPIWQIHPISGYFRTVTI
ncbi:hypothetical protein KKD49_06635, partial [Myxococcota bacterium]|nr:hypothetical protein [Myxococcota bacterium]